MISINDFAENEIDAWIGANRDRFIFLDPPQVLYLRRDLSPCWTFRMVKNKSSRIVLDHTEHTRIELGPDHKKVYLYHLIARKYTDIDTLTIPQSKSSKNSRVIGHLCGNAFCLTPSHLKVITKELNDEMTFCHFFMRRNPHMDFTPWCPHQPKCLINVLAPNQEL